MPAPTETTTTSLPTGLLTGLAGDARRQCRLAGLGGDVETMAVAMAAAGGLAAGLEGLAPGAAEALLALIRDSFARGYRMGAPAGHRPAAAPGPTHQTEDLE
jgi:hypothetical protein